MIEIKGIRFEVEITHKRIKNLYLRLKGNRIMASAPLRMPDYEVYRFIESKRDWIFRAYDQMKYKERISNLYRGGEYFYLFDEPYRLVRQIGRSNVSIQDKTIFLRYKDDSDDGIHYLYKVLDKRLLMKCRIMKSKWGVCYTKKNSITISSYLIHYPLYCLEYIMVHEMTHFIVPNHSKRFYEVVVNNMPDYKRAVKRLKL